MIKHIVSGLEMAGRAAGVLAGVELGRRALAATIGDDDGSVDGNESGGGYPLAFRLDPMHWVTPTPAEWAFGQSMRAQGASTADVKAALRAARERRREPQNAEAAAASTRDEAERWEGARKQAALAARANGDERRARAEARAAILSRRFRRLSAILSKRGADETDPDRAQAMVAQAAATAELAKAPPTPADVPPGADPFTSHVRNLVQAVASRAGDSLDAIADRIQAGRLGQEDWGEELSPEAALALVAGEDDGTDVAGDAVEGCGCRVAGPASAAYEPTALAHEPPDPSERAALLAAFAGLGGVTSGDEDEPTDEDGASLDQFFTGSKAAGADLPPAEVSGKDAAAESVGTLDELFQFQAVEPRAAVRRAAVLPSARRSRRGGCSGGSCPV